MFPWVAVYYYSIHLILKMRWFCTWGMLSFLNQFIHWLNCGSFLKLYCCFPCRLSSSHILFICGLRALGTESHGKIHLKNVTQMRATNCVVLPGVDIAIHVEHRGDVEVQVLHHFLHFWIYFVCLQDLILGSKQKQSRSDWWGDLLYML